MITIKNSCVRNELSLRYFEPSTFLHFHCVFTVLLMFVLCKWIVRYFNSCVAAYRAQFLKYSSKFLVFFLANFMADERGGNERRSMTISVTVLGVTLCVVFLAYVAFSEKASNSDVSTVKFAAIVSIELLRGRENQIFNLQLNDLFEFLFILKTTKTKGVPAWRKITIWSLSKWSASKFYVRWRLWRTHIGKIGLFCSFPILFDSNDFLL